MKCEKLMKVHMLMEWFILDFEAIKRFVITIKS